MSIATITALTALCPTKRKFSAYIVITFDGHKYAEGWSHDVYLDMHELDEYSIKSL